MLDVVLPAAGPAKEAGDHELLQAVRERQESRDSEVRIAPKQIFQPRGRRQHAQPSGSKDADDFTAQQRWTGNVLDRFQAQDGSEHIVPEGQGFAAGDDLQNAQAWLRAQALKDGVGLMVQGHDGRSGEVCNARGYSATAGSKIEDAQRTAEPGREELADLPAFGQPAYRKLQVLLFVSRRLALRASPNSCFVDGFEMLPGDCNIRRHSMQFISTFKRPA